MLENFAEKDGSKAFIAWLTLGILWGITFVATNIGVQNLPSLLMGGIRFLIAGIVAMLIVFLASSWPKVTLKQLTNSALVGIFMFGLGNGCVNLAQNHVSASVTSIVLATPPIIVSLIDTFLPHGTRLQAKGWFGLIICFMAIFWMWMPEDQESSGSWSSLLLLMAASWAWAIGVLYGRHQERIPDIWTDVSVQCFAAGAFQVGVGSYMGMWASWENNLNGWLAILFLALIGTIIGNWCLVYIIDRMPPAKVMTYAYVNPVSAMLAGWLVLNEVITWRMIVAALIIIFGVILSQSSKVKGSISMKQKPLLVKYKD